MTWTRDGAENWRVNTLADGANGRLFVGTDNGIFYDSLQVDSVKNTNGAFIKLDTSRSGWEESGWHMDSIFTNYFYPKIYDTTATDPLTIDSSKTDTVITYDTLWLHNQWYAMSLAATAGGHIYGATYGHGLYLSTDNGVSWKVTNGIADSAVTSVLLNPTTGYLYASTTTGAFFKSANPDLTNSPPEVTQTTLKPLSAILEQNYPNPFNPTTNIPFILHEAGYTSLVIYDMLGKEVARLVDGVVTAGRHEARWDASSVSTGVYFYRLQTASTIKTGKLTLIK